MAEEKEIILKRILNHFEKIAPEIVKESANSITTEHPIIEFYDEDYYYEKTEGFFDDVDKNTLKKIIVDHKDKIDDIFLSYYKKVKK